MNVLSLFDGISCAQVALEKAGIEVDTYYSSEIDEHAMKITKSNFPDTVQLGNVMDIDIEELPEIDLLVGGSPCQGFSFAGRQRKFDDPRSKLVFEYARILKEVKPKYFLFENVNMKQWCQDVISKNLGVKPIKINSRLVSAQNRVRLYWTNIPSLEQPKDRNISISEVLEDETGHIAAIRGRYLLNGKTAQFVELRKDNKSNTITTVQKDNVVVKHEYKKGTLAAKAEYRNLTCVECERLQTLPDGYTEYVSDHRRYKLIGGGMTIDVISHILKNLN